MVLYSFYIFDRHSEKPAVLSPSAPPLTVPSRVHLQQAMDAAASLVDQQDGTSAVGVEHHEQR